MTPSIFRVRTAPVSRQALRLCPSTLMAPVRGDTYSAASKAMFEMFRDIP
ncbi:nucleotidyltransferase/DNA polymerase involved in DNA repair [Mycobacteroides chelonae]|nr:nucleotidyltransferase/DNA polymerase involved in DNA repair [Mycobacteroides chelonae]